MKQFYISILSLIFLSNSLVAQTIPNGGFESWTSHTTYNTPDGWATMNNMTAVSGVFTCLKGTPGSPGSSYLKLISKTVSGGVVNGVAMCGNIDTLTMQPNGGFPCAGRPASLTGKWQHMIFGSSQGSVEVVLTRWDSNMNARMTVGIGSVTLSGMAMSWANFSVPINYTDGSNADSCLIVLEASGSNPTNNDYLWVDNLAFSGTVTGISSPKSDRAFTVFPNPAHAELNIDLRTLQGDATITIKDVSGQTLRAATPIATGSIRTISTANLKAGIYIVSIQQGEHEMKSLFLHY